MPLEFPRANQVQELLKVLKRPTSTLFDDGAIPIKIPGIAKIEPKVDFNITWNRMCDYGRTPNCPKCEDPIEDKRHNEECRERFRKILEEEGKLKQ